MDDAQARREFALPPTDGTFQGSDLSTLDPERDDDRAILVRAQHPELATAIERGEATVLVGGEQVDPQLHITLHELVTKQLLDDDPPAVWATATRLQERGFERHEIFHMLGSALARQLWRVQQEGEPVDVDEYERALSALPGSWERRQRSTKRKAAQKAERSRKRQRRGR